MFENCFVSSVINLIGWNSHFKIFETICLQMPWSVCFAAYSKFKFLIQFKYGESNFGSPQ